METRAINKSNQNNILNKHSYKIKGIGVRGRVFWVWGHSLSLQEETNIMCSYLLNPRNELRNLALRVQVPNSHILS